MAVGEQAEVSGTSDDVLDGFRRIRERAQRVADYYGFAFYIANGWYNEQKGWKSEDRAATDVEQQMWEALDRLAPADLKASNE